MNTLNLIPPKIKKEQWINQVIGVVFGFGFFIAIIAILFFGAVYATNYLVEKNLNDTLSQLDEEKMKIDNLKDIEEDVNLVNSKIEKITKLQESNVNLPILMQEINSSIPDKVKIDSLQLNAKSNTVTISGSAETRRDIVKLQEKLNSLSNFSKLLFATSSYNQNEAMYTFNMSGDFNK